MFGDEMLTFCFIPEFPIILSPLSSDWSSGSLNQFIAVYNGSGELISNIKYYDGFMGQRIGAISCLAFHPHWVSMDIVMFVLCVEWLPSPPGLFIGPLAVGGA